MKNPKKKRLKEIIKKENLAIQFMTFNKHDFLQTSVRILFNKYI